MRARHGNYRLPAIDDRPGLVPSALPCGMVHPRQAGNLRLEGVLESVYGVEGGRPGEGRLDDCEVVGAEVNFDASIRGLGVRARYNFRFVEQGTAFRGLVPTVDVPWNEPPAPLP